MSFCNDHVERNHLSYTVVHCDKLKLCYGETPIDWRRRQEPVDVTAPRIVENNVRAEIRSSARNELSPSNVQTTSPPRNRTTINTNDTSASSDRTTELFERGGHLSATDERPVDKSKPRRTAQFEQYRCFWTSWSTYRGRGSYFASCRLVGRIAISGHRS